MNLGIFRVDQRTGSSSLVAKATSWAEAKKRIDERFWLEFSDLRNQTAFRIRDLLADEDAQLTNFGNAQ